MDKESYNKMNMDFVLVTDQNYIIPTYVMMLSVLDNNPCKCAFHIISKDMNEKTMQIFKDLCRKYDCKTLFYEAPSKYDKMLPINQNGQKEYISAAAYYRLFLTDILPESIEKIIYLDGDIVCRHSLLPLWETNISDYPVAAIKDIASDMDLYERLKYDKKYGYFNSGVLLINLKYWRNYDITTTALDFIKQNWKDLLCHDQDVINCLFKGHIKELPITYNLQDYFLRKDNTYRPCSNIEFMSSLYDPTLVHFCTSVKPWFKGCAHPYRKDFLKYYKKSPWGSVPLKTFPSNSLKGTISNFFVHLGLKKYNNNYVKL